MALLEERHWAPATFRERGVAVPFTSPVLAGARVRLTERRHDLIVPHPGGARGVYILALASLAEFCSPSLHDLQLVERLRTQNSLSPSCIRLVARGVAAEGAAGRAAAATALATQTAERQRRSAFELWLLTSLAQDAGSHLQDGGEAQRARQALIRLAACTGRTIEVVRADLDLMVTQLAASGLTLPGEATRSGRMSALLDRMAALTQQLRAVGAVPGSNTALARVADNAEAAAAAGRLLLAEAQAILADPAAFLASWAAAPAELAHRIARPDWLLDGWERICLMWQVSEPDSRRLEAVVETHSLLTPVPIEAEGWLACVPALWRLLSQPAAAAATLPSAVRAPSQAGLLIARNERIRALAA